MQLIVDFGMVYRLSDAKYRRFLRDVAKGDDSQVKALCDYGKYLGSLHNVTDLNQEEAISLLEDLKKQSQ